MGTLEQLIKLFFSPAVFGKSDELNRTDRAG
jgi:hypothetical protein